MKKFKVTLGTGEVILVPAESQVDLVLNLRELSIGSFKVQPTVKVACVHWTCDDNGHKVRNVHDWFDTMNAVRGQKSCPQHRS